MICHYEFVALFKMCGTLIDGLLKKCGGKVRIVCMTLYMLKISFGFLKVGAGFKRMIASIFFFLNFNCFN